MPWPLRCSGSARPDAPPLIASMLVDVLDLVADSILVGVAGLTALEARAVLRALADT